MQGRRLPGRPHEPPCRVHGAVPPTPRPRVRRGCRGPVALVHAGGRVGWGWGPAPGMWVTTASLLGTNTGPANPRPTRRWPGIGPPPLRWPRGGGWKITSQPGSRLPTCLRHRKLGPASAAPPPLKPGILASYLLSLSSVWPPGFSSDGRLLHDSRRISACRRLVVLSRSNRVFSSCS